MAGAGEPQAWREDTTAAGAPASALTTLVKAEPSEGGAGVVAEAGGSAECGAGAAAAEATPEESPAGAGDDAAAAPVVQAALDCGIEQATVDAVLTSIRGC